MTQALGPTLVLGSGPVGLVSALVLGRTIPVTLAPLREYVAGPARIDAVPLQTLANLIELGIHPHELAVNDTHRLIMTGWENARPSPRQIAPKVHLNRTRLAAALWRQVERSPAIKVEPGADRSRFVRVIDATGRRAVTASETVQPEVAWVARTRTVSGRIGLSQAALKIAPMADGYAYRLGTEDHLTFGLVAPASLSRQSEDARIEALRESGGSWLLAGLPAFDQMEPGRGGLCSVQWSFGTGESMPVGDARFAPDALASQGLALGISQALLLAETEGTDMADMSNLIPHLNNVKSAIATCRFGRCATWQDYAQFLECGLQ